MKLIKITLFITIGILLNSCASGYELTSPNTINYISTNTNSGVTLNYKYNLLEKKYEKKEVKKGVKLVALKVTNNTEKDLTLGRDIKLTYGNGDELVVIDNNKVFTSLKQSPATHLLYLLLTPLNLYTTKTSSSGYTETTSSTPIGIVLGPGLAAGNMIAAGSANKKFKDELLKYNIYGTTIKKGETKHGLIGVRTETFDAIKISVK